MLAVGNNKGNASFSMCCRYGNVKPPNIQTPPDLLQTLLTASTKDATEFRRNIRAYNNLLSFASKGITGKLFESGPTGNRIG